MFLIEIKACINCFCIYMQTEAFRRLYGYKGMFASAFSDELLALICF